MGPNCKLISVQRMTWRAHLSTGQLTADRGKAAPPISSDGAVRKGLHCSGRLQIAVVFGELSSHKAHRQRNSSVAAVGANGLLSHKVGRITARLRWLVAFQSASVPNRGVKGVTQPQNKSGPLGGGDSARSQ